MHENCTGTLEKRVWKDHRVRLRCRKCGWTLLYRDFDLEPQTSHPESASTAADAFADLLPAPPGSMAVPARAPSRHEVDRRQGARAARVV